MRDIIRECEKYVAMYGINSDKLQVITLRILSMQTQNDFDLPINIGMIFDISRRYKDNMDIFLGA